MRRFVIEQGAKLRPIDDGLEAQLNSAYTSTIRLDLQDADYVVALALALGESKELEWVGKTLDLSKAYTSNCRFPQTTETLLWSSLGIKMGTPDTTSLML